MTRKTVKLFAIYLPVYNANGGMFETDHHRKWDEAICKLAGGVTVRKATLRGRWFGKDRVTIAEDIIEAEIGCSEKVLEKIVAFTKKHYRQEAIAIKPLGVMRIYS
jgi:hypothetical protein